MARVFSEETLKALYDAKYPGKGHFYEWLEHMEVLGYIEKIEFNNYTVDVDESEIIYKPECNLIGFDGNIFNLIGLASKALKKEGMNEYADEMSKRCFSSGSYYEALNIIGEYVRIR